MTKLYKFAIAAGLSVFVALAGLTAKPVPAQADGGFIAGLIIGGVAGHIITKHHHRHYHAYPPRRVHRYHAHDAHRHWCHRRYKSYDAYSNTWVSYSGHVRQCRSPYWG